MSRDYYFYVESCISGEFVVPEGYPIGPYEREARGEFTWLRGSSQVASSLFFGPDALFPFRQGAPAFSNHSALFRSLGPNFDPEMDERRICWIAYADLMVDLWDEMQIIVRSTIPSRNAHLFGDGRQAFPFAALKNLGSSDFDLGYLCRGSVTKEAIDRTRGRERFLLENANSETRIAVTFMMTVSDYLDSQRVEAFRGLRRYGKDSELRIISLFC